MGGFGIAVGVAISAALFAFQLSLAYPTLPLAEGARVVALENRDAEAGGEERRSLHHFLTWRAEPRTVAEVAAFRAVDRNRTAGRLRMAVGILAAQGPTRRGIPGTKALRTDA